jgi:hypothetical protein
VSHMSQPKSQSPGQIESVTGVHDRVPRLPTRAFLNLVEPAESACQGVKDR